ncbi:MAG TPA: sugar phosphate isomerase/epimerase family protein [Vicinamibacterales bacterium]|nr:sugar phosphate isomerase/epimerase family protein [Vicinamibacterales bacterium]
MRFGISTHLYHGRLLEHDHLVQVASFGFEAIELFATRSHFDYRDQAAVDRLAGWLADTGLALHGIHAPITEVFGGGTWAPRFSNALADNALRLAAVRETEAALQIATRIPFDVMVVHLGTPSSKEQPGDNSRSAAVRSLEEICRLARPFGVRVAVEVIPNRLSDAGSLVRLLEQEIDDRHAGICLDFGHAHLMGDVADAIETAAELLITTHVHDNHGRDDEHLVPYQGSIDWDLALVSMQKLGYEGTYLMELEGSRDPAGILEDARRARQRIELALARS